MAVWKEEFNIADELIKKGADLKEFRELGQLNQVRLVLNRESFTLCSETLQQIGASLPALWIALKVNPGLPEAEDAAGTDFIYFLFANMLAVTAKEITRNRAVDLVIPYLNTQCLLRSALVETFEHFRNDSGTLAVVCRLVKEYRARQYRFEAHEIDQIVSACIMHAEGVNELNEILQFFPKNAINTSYGIGDKSVLSITICNKHYLHALCLVKAGARLEKSSFGESPLVPLWQLLAETKKTEEKLRVTVFWQDETKQSLHEKLGTMQTLFRSLVIDLNSRGIDLLSPSELKKLGPMLIRLSFELPLRDLKREIRHIIEENSSCRIA